jgi:O-antigen/teichoic acid export membrane protein
VGTAAESHGVRLAYGLPGRAKTPQHGVMPDTSADVTARTDEQADVVQSRRATALIFGVTLLNALGNVVFHALVARHAGTSGYGTVATLLSFGTVSLVVAAGIQYAVARRTAQPGATAHGELARGGRALGPWLALSVLLALAAGPAASYLHLKQDDAVVFAVAYFAANIVQAVPLGVLIGQRRFRSWALVVIVAVGCRLVLLAALGSNGSSDTGAIVASALSTVFSALFAASWILVRGRSQSIWKRGTSAATVGPAGVRGDLAPDPSMTAPGNGRSDVGALAREGIGGAILGAGLWVVWILPLVFARHYLPSGAAGRFGAAQFVASGVLYLVGAVTTAFFPSVAQHRSGRSVAAGAGLAASLSLACVVVLVLVGPPVLTHLYGADFLVSRQLMLVLGLSATSIALGTFGLWISRALQPTLLPPALMLSAALLAECLQGVWWHGGTVPLAAGPAVAAGVAVVVGITMSAFAPLRSRMVLIRPEPSQLEEPV